VANKFIISEKCTVLGYYAASSGSSLPTFRENLSLGSVPFEMGLIGCPETSVRNYCYSLRNNSEECSFNLLRDGSPKSCIIFSAFHTR